MLKTKSILKIAIAPFKIYGTQIKTIAWLGLSKTVNDHTTARQKELSHAVNIFRANQKNLTISIQKCSSNILSTQLTKLDTTTTVGKITTVLLLLQRRLFQLPFPTYIYLSCLLTITSIMEQGTFILVWEYSITRRIEQMLV